MKNTVKIFFIIYLLFIYSFIFSNPVVSASDKFLFLPFKYSASLWQGWYYNDGTKHEGIDYGCDVGDPIFAATDGIAMHSTQKIDSTYAYGNFVFISHQNGYATLYAHLNKVSENIKKYPENLRGNTNYEEWAKIKRGDYIGSCGKTGTVVSHLHFETTLNKYALDRIDPYDLYKISSYYPSNLEYTKLGENYLWQTDPPDFIKSEEQPPIQLQSEKESTWTNIKNFIINLFSPDDLAQSEEEQGLEELDVGEPESVEEVETTETPVYDLQISNTPQNLDVTVGEKETQIVVKAKNVGNTAWERDKISINVVQDQNDPYYHESWLTQKRPARLDQNKIEPEGTGTFSTTINLPQKEGSYTFKLQIVRQEGKRFFQVGDRFFVLNINVFFDELLEPEDEIVEEEKENLGEKIKDAVEDVIDDVTDKTKEAVKDIGETITDLPKIIFGGGGGGSSTPDSTPEESVEEEQVMETPEIAIILPASTSTITNISTTTIVGTKNDATEKVFINDISDGVVFSSSTVWEQEINLVEGVNIFEIYGENSIGEKTVTSTIEIILDSTAPSVPVILTELDTSTTPTTHIAWSSADEGVGIKNYDVEYKIDEDDWQSLLVETTSTEYFMEVELLKTYQFRACVRDDLENTSQWSGGESILIDWPKTVVINELSWAGTGEGYPCSSHEWIELFNNTEVTVDLSGWKILVGSQNIELSGEIEAGGYYLLARKRDKKREPMSGVTIDLVWQDVEIPDEGSRLLLQDASENIIDELNFSSGWPAGSKSGGSYDYFYQPMGRLDSGLPGNLVNNWETQNHIGSLASSERCLELFGSPRKDNDSLWYIKQPRFNYTEQYDENNIWIFSKEHSPYIIGSEFEIPIGSTWKIGPGTIFISGHKNFYMEVGGRLEINGTADEPVVFTSARDLTYGDWNVPYFEQMAEPEIPEAGDWSRIEIKNGASAVINNAKFLYGGQSFKRTDGFFATKWLSYVLLITGGNISINNSEFINTYYNERYPDYSAVVWADNSDSVSTTVNINNSLFDTGWIAIKAKDSYSGSYFSVVENNNTFLNFSSPSGPTDLSGVEISTSTPD